MPTRRDTLIMRLAEMADVLDAPDGPGGGAILREAISEISSLHRQVVSAYAVAALAAPVASFADLPEPVEWR